LRTNNGSIRITNLFHTNRYANTFNYACTNAIANVNANRSANVLSSNS